MSRIWAAHRPTGGRRIHPRCPGLGHYPDRDAAAAAGARLGSVPAECGRCGGYHLAIPRTGGQR